MREAFLRAGPALLFLTTLFVPLAFGAGEGTTPVEKTDPKGIARQSDAMIRFAELMIEHGREGHTEEIVKYAKEMVRTTQDLVKKVSAQEGPKAPALPQLSKVIQAGRRAIKEGEAGRLSPALGDARKALHHARIGRDLLDAD